MNYTWNNKTVDTYPTLEGNNDVIFNVHWRLTGQDEDGNVGSSYGTQSLETSDLSILQHLLILQKKILMDGLRQR